MQKIALYIPEIREALKDKDFEELKRILEVQPAVDIAAGWGKFSVKEKKIIFKNIEFLIRIDVFERLYFNHQKFLAEELPPKDIIPVLDRMAPDERVDFFEKLSSSKSNKFFKHMEEENVENVKKLMVYAPDSAGGKMTTEFVKLKPGMTAREALIKLNQYLARRQSRKIYALYLVDDKYRVTGGVSLQRLITSKPDNKVEELAKPVDNIKVYVNRDQEEVARMFAHYDILSAPVVNKEDKMLGVITIEDIVDVIHQETEEDIARMSGVDPGEFKKYSFMKALKTRLPWLLLAYIGGLAAAGIIGRYETTLESIVALAAFIPVIMHMGGTVGVQSSTVIVRGFALGKIETGRIGRILLREFSVGFILSAGYAVLLGLLSQLRYGTSAGAARIGLVTGLGLGLVMLLGAVTGVCLPFGFKKFGIDPAIATGPIITPLIDIAGLGIYFGLASALML